MQFKALASGLMLGGAVLFVMVLLRSLQGIIQTVMRIGIVLLAIYIGYELVSGWTA